VRAVEGSYWLIHVRRLQWQRGPLGHVRRFLDLAEKHAELGAQRSAVPFLRECRRLRERIRRERATCIAVERETRLPFRPEGQCRRPLRGRSTE
jgi:hypothetical protein